MQLKPLQTVSWAKIRLIWKSVIENLGVDKSTASENFWVRRWGRGSNLKPKLNPKPFWAISRVETGLIRKSIPKNLGVLARTTSGSLWRAARSLWNKSTFYFGHRPWPLEPISGLGTRDIGISASDWPRKIQGCNRFFTLKNPPEPPLGALDASVLPTNNNN